MDLILWRHAEAEDGMPDSGRELTKRGRKQAAQIGAWLRKHLPEQCAILASPAKRTQQTADALGLPYDVVKDVGTGAAPAQILVAAGWPRREGAVLVVGHQPTLGGVASLLLCGEEADWTVKKGAVWWFSCRAGHGGDVVLRAVIGPEMV
jgi:phosphohistidine phosphatase